MKQHYSTVSEDEQREGLGLVLSRVKAEGVEIMKARTADAVAAANEPPVDIKADATAATSETSTNPEQPG